MYKLIYLDPEPYKYRNVDALNIPFFTYLFTCLLFSSSSTCFKMRYAVVHVTMSDLALAEAAPQSLYAGLPPSLSSRTDSKVTLATISQNHNYPASRGAAVSARKDGYQYGPSLIGEAAFFPTGPLGDAHRDTTESYPPILGGWFIPLRRG